jgi:hypothetical protein
MSTGQSITYYSTGFGSFPATFSANPNTDANHWSFYATLQGQAPTLSLSFNPPNPTVPPDAPLGTIVAQVVPMWSDGSKFTGTVDLTHPPYFGDGGVFALDGSFNVIVNPSGPGVSGDGGTVQNITVSATQ